MHDAAANLAVMKIPRPFSSEPVELNIESTLSIFISLLSKLCDFAIFFLVMLLMATDSSGCCNRNIKAIHEYTCKLTHENNNLN